MSFAPSAQLMPTLNGLACAIETQKASIVCPDNVRPLRSVMVTEIINGSRWSVVVCRSSYSSSIATIAAFAFSVSTIVSTSSRSQPPSIRPRACSLKAFFSASNVMLRKAGLLTSGEIERMRLVGPIEPAANRGRDGSLAVYSSHAVRASLAPSRFSS